jgi:hypothetical protein
MLCPDQKQVLVWDSVTCDHHFIALPAPFDTKGVEIKGAVLCAAGDVHQFQVVLVAAGDDDELPRRVFVCFYSSETGVWGNLVSTPLSPIPRKTWLTMTYMDILNSIVLSCMPAVLVGGSLYWTLVGDHARILEFDLERQTLAVMQVPVGMSEERDESTVMRAEGGVLGFLYVSEWDLSAQLWKLNKDCNCVASWVLGRTIKIDKLFSLKLMMDRTSLRILGFAECNNVALLASGAGLFMLHLESLQFKKLSQTDEMFSVRHPFESVYTAGNSTPLHS